MKKGLVEHCNSILDANHVTEYQNTLSVNDGKSKVDT